MFTTNNSQLELSPTIKSVFCFFVGQFVSFFLCQLIHFSQSKQVRVSHQFPSFHANSLNLHIILLYFLGYIIFFLATCVHNSTFGTHFLIQDNWLPVVMLCSYTQYVFESFSEKQINILFFSLNFEEWLPQSIVDCIVCDCIVVVLYLFFVDLCGFDGTKLNCYDQGGTRARSPLPPIGNIHRPIYIVFFIKTQIKF